jgi:hypothetical protein
MTQAHKSVWRNRAMILAIALISAGPFGLAWFYARHPELIETRSNYGTLFIPPPQTDVSQLSAKPLARAEALPDIRGRWVLLQFVPKACGEACAAVVHKTHQTRLMLNKETQRVRRVLLVSGEPKANDFVGLLGQDEDLMVAAAPPALVETVATALGGPPEPNLVVLMDPLGNLVLWYEPTFDPYKLLKDLRHLLKASQIG